ncbi:MAG: hypothetical protein AAFN93_27940 [Bacteroidota bacterium]
MSRKSKFAGMFNAAHQINDFSEASAASTEDIQNIEISRIYVNPGQSRKYFDPDEQEKLRNSIQKNAFFCLFES